VIVLQRPARPVERVFDVNAPRCEVDALDLSQDIARAAQLGADRGDDVARLEVARRNLREHRREHREILAADDGDLGFLRPERPLEAASRRHPGEASTQDQDSRHDGAAGQSGRSRWISTTRRT
jgi:hypothetical protein